MLRLFDGPSASLSTSEKGRAAAPVRCRKRRRVRATRKRAAEAARMDVKEQKAPSPGANQRVHYGRREGNL